MIEKIKEYFEYRRNKKIAKRELARITATTLPLIRDFTDKSNSVWKNVVRISDEASKLDGKELIEMILGEVSSILQIREERLVEIITYLASLTPSEQTGAIIESIVETANIGKDE